MRRILPALILLSGAATAAAGDLVPTDTRFGPLRVKSHQVETTIDNQVAITKVTQVFANDHDAQLEAIYVFPTPADASIIDFSMTVNGKLVRGELLEKNQAKQVYEKIVSRAKDPGLLEQVGKNVFRVRVFPILARSEQKIELTYVERVNYESGRCTWRYPLKVPGSSIVTKTDSMDVTVRIRSLISIKDCAGPFDVSRASERELTATLRKANADLSKDLELSYTLVREKSGFDVVVHRAKEDGYFLLLVTPGVDAAEGAMAKDMTFVFDTSGSMNGEKMTQAKAALRFCISKLKPEDRFNIVSFSDAAATFRNEPVLASTENTKAAGAYIDRLDALGSTNIQDALLRALAHRPEKGRPHMIVFMTDGQPTVGETDPKALLRRVLADNREDVRIFTFGVGDDVNRQLLEDLADATRAVACFVAPGQDLEAAVSTLQRRIVSPVISGIEIDWGGADAHAVYPKQIPDLYAGVQLMVAGRYGKPGTHKVTLRGRVGVKDVTVAQDVTFPEARATSDAIKYIWGARKIGDLLDRIRRNGETQEAIADVVRLSREYRVATPYTSFLVLEDEAAYDREGIDRKGADFKQPGQTAKGDKDDDPVGRVHFFPEANSFDHNESADHEGYRAMKGDSKEFLSYLPGTHDSMGVGGGGRGGGRFGERSVRSTQKDEAILKALKWLAKNQNDDGSWGDQDVEATALSLLAFLGAGYTHLSKEMDFGKTVKKSLQWIVAHQDSDGRIGKGVPHLMAAMALAEAYSLSGSAILKDPAQRALDASVASDEPLSMAWLLLAGKSGELACLTVPKSLTEALRKWLASFTPKDTREEAIRALARIFIERKRDAALASQIHTLLQSKPDDPWTWHFASMAIFQFDGPEGACWKPWSERLRETLVKSQAKDGSWDSKAVPTATHALSLEVRYRYFTVFGTKK